MTARSWPPSRRAQTARRLLLSLTRWRFEPKRGFRRVKTLISWRPDPSLIGQWTLVGWLLGTVALGLVQMSRIIRFQALLREAVPAPDWVAEEAQRIGDRLGVGCPRCSAVPSWVRRCSGAWAGPSSCSLRRSSSRSSLAAGAGSWPTSWPTSAAATTGSAASSWSPVCSGGGTRSTG